MKISGHHWPKGSISVPPIPPDAERQKDWLTNKHISILNANQVFTTYNHKEHLRTKRILFTHLGGGIGDVIAFSSIAEFLSHKTLTVFCDERHFPIFKWFSNQNIRVKEFYSVIVPDFTPANRLTRYSNYARLRMEWAAIEAREGNWYDAMFTRIGIPGAPVEYKRPHLVGRTDIKSNHVKAKKSVIISHRASCQMRSSRFEDFYWPVKNAMPEYKIHVHQSDLTADDTTFIWDNCMNDVNIIPPCSLDDYLANLYAAAMVVCTDTGAIHFREGVQKPCLAAFSAMTTGSRTSGYKFTKSFDVVSNCEHQPCFIHETKAGLKCPLWVEGENIAPCQSGESFQNQLYQQLKSYGI